MYGLIKCFFFSFYVTPQKRTVFSVTTCLLFPISTIVVVFCCWSTGRTPTEISAKVCNQILFILFVYFSQRRNICIEGYVYVPKFSRKYLRQYPKKKYIIGSKSLITFRNSYALDFLYFYRSVSLSVDEKKKEKSLD